MFKVSISQDFFSFRKEVDDLETAMRIVTYYVVHVCQMDPVLVFIHSKHGYWFWHLTREDVAKVWLSCLN